MCFSSLYSHHAFEIKRRRHTIFQEWAPYNDAVTDHEEDGPRANSGLTMRWKQQMSLDKIDFLEELLMYSWREHSKKWKGRRRKVALERHSSVYPLGPLM